MLAGEANIRETVLRGNHGQSGRACRMPIDLRPRKGGEAVRIAQAG